MKPSKQPLHGNRVEDIFTDSLDDIISVLNMKKDVSLRNFRAVNESIDFDVGEVLNFKENKNYKELDIFKDITDQFQKKTDLVTLATQITQTTKPSIVDPKPQDVEINKLGKVLEEQDENKLAETTKLALPEPNLTIHPKYGL